MVQNEDYRLNGKKVHCYFGGDLKFEAALMGHQGSGCTKPSFTDHGT